MLRSTDDVVEIRRWAEQRGGRPARDPATGRLLVVAPGAPGAAIAVGWDEFETTLLWDHLVCVYDDAPGSLRCFCGPMAEAHAYVTAECAATAAGPR